MLKISDFLRMAGSMVSESKAFRAKQQLVEKADGSKECSWVSVAAGEVKTEQALGG